MKYCSLNDVIAWFIAFPKIPNLLQMMVWLQFYKEKSKSESIPSRKAFLTNIRLLFFLFFSTLLAVLQPPQIKPKKSIMLIHGLGLPTGREQNTDRSLKLWFIAAIDFCCFSCCCSYSEMSQLRHIYKLYATLYTALRCTNQMLEHYRANK